jgi:hypothetical protein
MSSSDAESLGSKHNRGLDWNNKLGEDLLLDAETCPQLASRTMYVIVQIILKV